MTKQKSLKDRIRARQAKTGESYATARTHVLGDKMEVTAPAAAEPTKHEAVVLKVNQQSARARILGEDGQITFRSGDIHGLEPIVPGHVVDLVVDKRWTWRGDNYASGQMKNPRIDIEKLELTPLPLEGGEREDVREYAEPFNEEEDGPYAKLWKKHTAKPRLSYEFHEIAWGQRSGVDDPEENPTCMAAELMEMGRAEEARELLMEALGTDLRVIDAHAHLGNWAFDRSPERALKHYEIGMKIGELSLPQNEDILLTWGRIYNRPFLRCLHGYGLCLWRAGDFAGARAVFERVLSYNPTDNQGVRVCWQDLRAGRAWEAEQDEEDRILGERKIHH